MPRPSVFGMGLPLALLLLAACGEEGDTTSPVQTASCPPIETHPLFPTTALQDGLCQLGPLTSDGEPADPADPDCLQARRWIVGLHAEADDQGCPVLVEGGIVCDAACLNFSKSVDSAERNIPACSGKVDLQPEGWRIGELFSSEIGSVPGWDFFCADGEIRSKESVVDVGGIWKVRQPPLIDCGENGCIGASERYRPPTSLASTGLADFFPAFCVADEAPDGEDWTWESPNPKEGCPHNAPDNEISGLYFPCPAKTFCHNSIVYGCAAGADEWGCPLKTYVWEIEAAAEPCGDYWQAPTSDQESPL